MKKIAFILLVFCSQLVSAQYNFQKIISNANATYARDVIQASDTGFYITGSSSGYGDYSANAFLMKLDKQGNFEWVKSYGGNNVDWAVRFVQNTDKSLVFAGYSNSGGNGGYDTWVFKTDSLGNLLWEKRFGGSDWDFGKCIIATNDGGYMVCGETYSFGNGNNDAFLLKLDANGDSLWMQTYGGASNDWAEKVIQTQDGNYVFIGSTNTGATRKHDAMIIKTDAIGNVIWQQYYGSTKEDFGSAIIEWQFNDDLLFVGTTDSITANKTDMFFIRANDLGSIICYQPFGGNENETVHDIVQRHNNNVYFVGQSLSYGFYGDFMNYESDMGCWWQNGPTYGTTSIEEAWSIKTTSDSGSVIIGDTKSGAGISSIFIVKLDLGEIWGPPITNYFDVTEVEEFSNENTFSVYPNPSNGKFRVILSKDISEGELFIYSITGQVVFETSIINREFDLDLSVLPKGIYLISVLDLSVQKRKLMKILIK